MSTVLFCKKNRTGMLGRRIRLNFDVLAAPWRR
jgi:hypothetical protein